MWALKCEYKSYMSFANCLNFSHNRQMATIMTHALVAGTFYKLTQKKNRLILKLCLIGSILPDADVLGFRFGIEYAHPLGHRGFTHSILFGLLYALFCLIFFRKESHKSKIFLFLLFFFSIMSHGLLDMLTNGGLGVGLFIPFENSRYFFPITPLEVSPIGAHFFSPRGIAVLLNEFKLIALPCIGILVTIFIRKRLLKKLKS